LKCPSKINFPLYCSALRRHGFLAHSTNYGQSKQVFLFALTTIGKISEETMALKTATVKRKTDFRRAFQPYLYLLPAFIVLGVITFYPLIYQVIIRLPTSKPKIFSWD